MASLIYDDKELMRALLEAGVHFGHQTKRWNPKMKPYIFMKRNGIYIVDLRYTIEKLKEAYHALKDVVAKGGTVLFVGTKKQAQASIVEESQRCGQMAVSKRWLGGTLTNYSTIKKSIDKLKKMEKRLEMDRDHMIKKEAVTIEKSIERMKGFYDGIRDMKGVPAAMWVVDTKREINAINEAKNLGVKIFGVADTNSDPDLLDHLVPGNDDAIRAVKLLTSIMADAVIEGSTIAAKKDVALMEETVPEASEEAKEEATPAETVAEEAPQEVAAPVAATEETPQEAPKEETE